MENKLFYKKLFPLLTNYDLIPNSESDSYNCISHTIHLKEDISWPIDTRHYWPTKRELTKESFDLFYEHHGFEKLSILDFTYNENYTKVVLYTNNNIPTHAAIQIDNTYWESKIGRLGIIRHDLFEIENDVYGEITQIYRKRNILKENLIFKFRDFIKIIN
jgi:hypothetical protein